MPAHIQSTAQQLGKLSHLPQLWASAYAVLAPLTLRRLFLVPLLATLTTPAPSSPHPNPAIPSLLFFLTSYLPWTACTTTRIVNACMHTPSLELVPWMLVCTLRGKSKGYGKCYDAFWLDTSSTFTTIICKLINACVHTVVLEAPV